MLGDLLDRQVAAEAGYRPLEAQRVAAVRSEEAVSFRSDRATVGTAQLPVRHHQFHTCMRQAQVPHPARPVHVQPPTILPADRTEGPRTLDRCQGDDRFHVRCQLDDRLIDRGYSCEGEVRCYTEIGHRVLRRSVNGSLDNSILLNRGTGVHFVYCLPATKSTKNLFPFSGALLGVSA